MDEICAKVELCTSLKTYLIELEEHFYDGMTWIKGSIIRYAINSVISKECIKWKERHDNKINKLVNDKHLKEGITSNPNTVITNLSNRVITNEEFNILKYGLKHGLAIKPHQK